MDGTASMRTTLLLDERDMENRRIVADGLRSNDSEAVRKSLALAALIVRHQQNGGKVILEKGKRRQEVVYVL